MYVFLETSLLFKYPTVQKPIQLKQQVIKIIVKLSSNVYYGKEPRKEGKEFHSIGKSAVCPALCSLLKTVQRTRQTEFFPPGAYNLVRRCTIYRNTTTDQNKWA